MGWTSFDKCYCILNKRGQVDKRATMTHEIESYGDSKVVKAMMGGGNYYAVVHQLNRGYYYLLVSLTEVKDGEFWYKDMGDTMGPYYYDCPKAILDLADELCPCDDVYDPCGTAKAWRAKCRVKLAEKALPTAFKNVSPGECIDWHVPENSRLNVCGVSIAGMTVRLTKWAGRRSWITREFGGAMRVPVKYVNPADCTPIYSD